MSTATVLRAGFWLIVVPVLVGLGVQWWVTAPAAPQRTPAPARLDPCAAWVTHETPDSIAYEVWRARGARCRVTLPEGANFHRGRTP
jgi:hypothetical protein